MTKSFRKADNGRFTTAADNNQHPDKVVAETNKKTDSWEHLQSKLKVGGLRGTFVPLGDLAFFEGKRKGGGFEGRFMIFLEGDLRCHDVSNATKKKKTKIK